MAVSGVFYGTKKILMSDVKVTLVVENDSKYLKRIQKKISSVSYLPLHYANVVEITLQYPNYKSASAACRNFKKNPRIFEVSLNAFRSFK